MNKALQLLSLARKGGRIEAGEEPVDTCIRMGRARLILLASDASEHTCRRIRGRNAHNDSSQSHHKAESSPRQFTAAKSAYQPNRRIACLQNPGALHPEKRRASRLGEGSRDTRQQEIQHQVPPLEHNRFRRKTANHISDPAYAIGDRQPGSARCFVLVECHHRHENDCNPRKDTH